MSVESVLITGSNRGFGLEFVKQFMALPIPPRYIFATCRNPDAAHDLKELAKSYANVKVLKLDMKDVDSFHQVYQEVKSEVGDAGLNLLINNGAIKLVDSLDTVSKETMIENFEVNAVGPLLLVKELLPLLKKAASRMNTEALSCSRAGVINITSKRGSINRSTDGGFYPYRASKVALNMITKSLSVDLKPFGILALVLNPGWANTEMGGKNAAITTDIGVKGMLNIIFKSNEEQCGEFFNYDGERLLW